MTAIRDAAGRITGIRSNSAGLPVAITAPDGARATFVRDAFGRVTRATDALGETLRQGWTVQGKPHDTELRLKTVTNAQGLEWQYHYDAAGRLTSETDFDGRTVTYEHDPLGRLIRRINAAGQSLTYERDVMGRS
ncbi:hypothetical protein [Streptomyces sp. NPDC001450]